MPPLEDRIHPRQQAGACNEIDSLGFDASWSGLLAISANDLIEVQEQATGQSVISLNSNSGQKINLLRFEPGCQRSRLLASYENGDVLVWDVLANKIVSKISLPGRVSSLLWLPDSSSSQNTSEYFIAAVNAPSQLFLVNSCTGHINWSSKLDFSKDESVLKVVIDPQERSKLFVKTDKAILKIIDFSIEKEPKKSPRRLYLDYAARKFVFSRELLQSSDLADLSQSIGFGLMPSMPTMAFIAFRRAIVIFDMATLDIFSLVEMDKSTSPMISIYAAKYRPVLFAAHENASISVRAFQISSTNLEKGLKLLNACQSDGLRMTGWCKCRGLIVDPKSETNISLLLTDSRVLQFKLEVCQERENDGKFYVLKDRKTSDDFLGRLVGPTEITCEMENNLEKKNLALRLAGQNGHSIAPKDSLLEIGPPITTKNFLNWRPRAARGMKNGNVQIIDLYSGKCERELSVHSSQIKGMCWLDAEHVISWSATTGAAEGKVNNVVILLNIFSGRSKTLRRKSNESAIKTILPSPSTRHFLIFFASDFLGEAKVYQPPEFFCKTGKLLRRFPSFNSPYMYQAPSWLSKDGPEERIMFLDLENRIRILNVLDTKLREDKENRLKAEIGTVSAAAWKSNLMLLAYNDGFVCCIDTKSKTRASKPLLLRKPTSIAFAPGRGNTLAIIQSEKELSVWDIQELSEISRAKFKTLDAKSASWIAGDQIALECLDGSIRIVNENLRFDKMMFHPRSQIAKDNADELFDLKVIQGCLKAAEKNGEFDIDTMAQEIGKTGSQKDFEFVLHLRAVMQTNLDVDSWLVGGTVNGRDRIKLNIESRLARLLCQAPGDSAHHRRLTQLLSIFNKRDEAIEKLLSASVEKPDFEENSFRGLVILLCGESKNAELVKSHIKMMSASLIGAGKILDGVELLMMAGCVSDAIGQLLDAGHFILARQILSTIDDDGEDEELKELAAKIEAKWVTEALKSDRISTAVALMIESSKFDELFQLFAAHNQIFRCLVLHCFQPTIKAESSVFETVNANLLQVYEKYAIPVDQRKFIAINNS